MQGPAFQHEAQRPLSHDTWIDVLAAALGRVSPIARPLILYRQHANNAMGLATNRIDRVRQRVEEFRTVPVTIYEERIAFNTIMAAALRGVDPERHPDLAGAAAGTADRIDARSRALRRRLAIHRAPGLTDRLGAFGAVMRDRQGAVHASPLSLAKDLVLGVIGLGRHR